MTKEEYIGKYPIVCNNAGTKLYLERDDVLKAMDEYAKQQSIVFGIWKEINTCRSGEGEWQVRFDNWMKGHTIDQLYNLFIEQQNKSNGNKV